WNDLPKTNYNLGNYLKETNATPSALTLNAGAGAVTIDGGVGTSKALSSLTITSGQTSINGKGVVTTGAQHYSGGLTVTAADTLQISATTVTVGGSATLTATSTGVLLDAAMVNSSAVASSFNIQAGRHIRLAN